MPRYSKFESNNNSMWQYALSDIKAMDDMKGADQEYSSALTQYNSSANSGGEDIELLAFQTVTG